MEKLGFVPKEMDDQVARYNGPNYEFYWNGPYTTEELNEKIRKMISVRNDSVTEKAALVESEIIICHLN